MITNERFIKAKSGNINLALFFELMLGISISVAISIFCFAIALESVVMIVVAIVDFIVADSFIPLLISAASPKVEYEVNINGSLLQISYIKSHKKVDYNVTLNGKKVPYSKFICKRNQVPSTITDNLDMNKFKVQQIGFNIYNKSVYFCYNYIANDSVVLFCDDVPLAIRNCVLTKNVNKVFCNK